jgi:hypothetical protein
MATASTWRRGSRRSPSPAASLVSGDVYRQVRSKLPLSFQDMGEQRVKNIAEPVHAYRVLAEATRPCHPGVEVAPGARTLIWMRRGASSRIQPRAKFRIAALLAL